MGKTIGGIILGFIGVLFLVTNISERNPVAQVGGYFLSLLFLIFGIILFVKGVKTSSREKVTENEGKKGWTLPAKIGLTLILFLVIGYFFFGKDRDSRHTSQPVGNNLSQPIKESTKWNYSESKDKMRGTTTRFASIRSINELHFDFPYSGGSVGTLTLRTSPEFGKDVMLSIERGQFLCHSYDGCTVALKFDNKKVERYSAGEPSDSSSNLLFLRPYNKIVSNLRNAKHLAIEAEFYQEGRQQLEFEVSGLRWD